MQVCSIVGLIVLGHGLRLSCVGAVRLSGQISSSCVSCRWFSSFSGFCRPCGLLSSWFLSSSLSAFPASAGYADAGVFAVDGCADAAFLAWCSVSGDHGERVSRVRLVVDRVGASFWDGERCAAQPSSFPCCEAYHQLVLMLVNVISSRGVRLRVTPRELVRLNSTGCASSVSLVTLNATRHEQSG